MINNFSFNTNVGMSMLTVDNRGIREKSDGCVDVYMRTKMKFK